MASRNGSSSLTNGIWAVNGDFSNFLSTVGEYQFLELAVRTRDQQEDPVWCGMPFGQSWAVSCLWSQGLKSTQTRHLVQNRCPIMVAICHLIKGWILHGTKLCIYKPTTSLNISSVLQNKSWCSFLLKQLKVSSNAALEWRIEREIKISVHWSVNITQIWWDVYTATTENVSHVIILPEAVDWHLFLQKTRK